jgi:hypothetical protein
MARQKDEAAPVCGWSRPNCENEAVTSVHLDAGTETCSECGAEKTNRAEFKLCQEHMDVYAESGDVTMLLLSAKEA